MPHYIDYICAGNGTVLYNSCSREWEFFPSRIAAEQKLQININNWAGEDTSKAEAEMELLTRLLRDQ